MAEQGDFIGTKLGSRTTRQPTAKSEPAEKSKPKKPGDPKGRFRLKARFWNHPMTSALSHGEQAAWDYLWFLADAKGTCFPSMARIAERLGCSRRYAKDLVAGLRRKGYLGVLNRGSNTGKNRANTYRIALPPVTGDGEPGRPYQGNQDVP